MTTSKLARLLAEMVGTFVLTAVVLSIGKYGGTPINVTLAAAATLVGLILVLGPVSGGHFNPALTIGMLLIRKVSLIKAILYIACQMIGAYLAYQLFMWFTGATKDNLAVTVSEFDWQSFTAEVVGTAIFAMAMAAAVLRKYSLPQVAVSVGLGLFAGSLASSVVVAGNRIVTGVLNPAVALGTGYNIKEVSMSFFVAPVVGAIIGFGMYKLFFSEEALAAKAAVKPASAVTKVVSKPAAKTVKKPVKRTKKTK